MRKKIIAGNWKMNMTEMSGAELIEDLIPKVADASCEVVLCVPAILIHMMKAAAKGSNIEIGAQNVHWERSGAYTGEISAEMLKELDVRYTVIGHSERRAYFGETDETVNKRLKTALAYGITPIVCVGESLEQREKDETKNVLKRQTVAAFEGVEKASDVVVAYEPIWAIGTGRTATDEQAEEAIAYIREVIAGLYSKAEAEEVSILYGGSMNEGNVKGLMKMSDIDGGLIGGASLKPSFAQIVNYDK